MQFFKSRLYHRLFFFIVFFGIILLLMTGGCHNVSEFATTQISSPSPPVNCLFISIDTLRADHLSSYGYKDIKTPNIDALCSEGTRFSKAYTPVPVTLPAHCTMLTGLFPVRHGVRNNGTFKLTDDHTTLAELFHQAGYRTGAFVGAFVLDKRFGLDQGFEVYDDKLSSGNGEKNVFYYEDRPADKVIDAAISWLRSADSRPFFAWIHCFDPHAPYSPPSPFKEEYVQNLYDGEIAYVDMILGKLFNFLKEKNLYESTLICFTADHGEGLGQHEEKTHAIFIYDATLHVPLIFRMPEKIPQGQVIDREVMLADIFPTILDLAGMPYNGHVQGVSLFNPERLEKRTFEMPCESFYPFYNHKWSPLEGMRTGEWKYIRAPKSELYHLSEDPGELINLYDKMPDRVNNMERLLDRKIQEHESAAISRHAHIKMDSDTKKKLESLGYIWTASGESAGKDLASYPDPKDMIGLLDYLNRGTYFYTIGEYDRAIEEFRKLLKFNPNDVFTHFVLGYMYDRKGWTDIAITELETAVKLDPGYINAYNNLGTIYNKLGKREEAIHCFKKAIELNPSYVEAYDNAGVVYYLKNDYDQAMIYFQKTLELDPGYSKAYNNIGSVYVSKNQYDRAIEPIRKALEYDPDFVDAYNNLGSAYLGLGNVGEAKELFLKAIDLDPNHLEARINLATVYIQSDQHDLARREIDKILSINPNVAKAHNCLGTLLIKEGRPMEAIEEYKESIYLNPDLFETYYNLGIAYFNSGMIDDAIREYRRALKIDPDNPGAYVNLGIALFHKGLVDQAVNNYLKAAEFDPQNVEAMVNLGVAYYSLGVIDKAIEEYMKAIELRPKNIQALVNLGLAYFARGAIDKSIEEYQKVLEIDPNHTDARINLGVAYFNLQRYNDAIEQYKEVIRHHPQSFQTFYGIGYCYFMMGSYQEAMQYLREAIRLKPDYTEAFLLLDRAMALSVLGTKPL